MKNEVKEIESIQNSNHKLITDCNPVNFLERVNEAFDEGWKPSFEMQVLDNNYYIQYLTK